MKKYQSLVDALEEVGWYVTLAILTLGIQGAIHVNNIANLFEQCCIPLMHATNPHDSYQLSHTTHAQQTRNKTIVHKYLLLEQIRATNPISAPYNMLPKSIQIA